MKITGWFLIAITFIAGCYFDVKLMLVGGADEIAAWIRHAHGASLGAGVALVAFSGVIILASVAVCILWWYLFVGREARVADREAAERVRARMRARRPLR